MRWPLALLPLAVAGCAHTAGARFDADVSPVLPSPRGEVYTRVPAEPNDPLVASVVGGLPWDEALSGVATAVALAENSGDGMDSCRLRWLAVLAGYPFAPDGWLSTLVPQGQVPTDLIEVARGHARRSADIGLVRARVGEQDRWVLVAARPNGALPVLPRELAVGDDLALGEGDWEVADPLGELRPPAATVRLDTPGEWLVGLRGVDGRFVAALPVYVDATPPELPPARCEVGAGTAEQRAAAFVAGVRGRYGFDPLARDPALDSVARARLRAFVAGDPLPDARSQLQAAGYIGVPVAAGACVASTVEACLSELWWSPADRGPLVGDLADYGLAVWEGEGTVRIVLLGAG
jgi:hypothetical protein